jgi:hypothetical protein
MESCYFGVFRPRRGVVWGGYGGARVFHFKVEHTVSSAVAELRGEG